jgi:dynactin complex subunit
MFQFEIDDPEEQKAAAAGDSPSSSGKASTVAKDEGMVGFSIGDRIKFGNDVGEVKYIGSVGSHPGTWLGIEWDDPSRGKHNGNVDGVEYFKSSKPGNSASFVRPAKAMKLRSLMEAFQERYGDSNEAISTMKSIENRLEKKKIDSE